MLAFLVSPQPIPSVDGPFTTNLAYCGPPIFRETVARALPEFIDYHRYHAGEKG